MKNRDFFQITPIGGFGKIGGNSTLIGNSFLIDAGIEFPYEKTFGIDYLIPPFDLYQIPNTLIITHGHEDHIGAIPHLLAINPNIQIYAPNFAAALIRHKLNQLKLSFKLKSYQSFDTLVIDNYKIQFIPVDHSIPDTHGIFISRDDYCCFFSSDFKITSRQTSKQMLSKLKDLSRGYSRRILVADSTNILEQSSPSEELIFMNLSDLIESHGNRILMTCFSSNIERIEATVQIAKNNNRKVIPYGKSMRNYIACACELNLLDEKDFSNADAIDLESPKNIILISGCQGDFTSTLKRVASGEDPLIKPNNDDLFIYSAKVIPGNETQMNHVVDLLTCQGVTIATSNVHTSGHPDKDQLTQVYKSFSPTHAIPAHGSHYHLQMHANFCNEIAPNTQCIVIKNGDQLSFEPTPNHSVLDEKRKPYFIQAGQKVLPTVLKQRRKIASLGVITISIKSDSIRSRQLKHQFTFLGFPELTKDQEQNLSNLISNYFQKGKFKNFDAARTELTAKTRTFLKTFLNIKPVIIVHFV